MSWIRYELGPEAMTRYFSTNRPVWGLLYQLTTRLLPQVPAYWQIFALALALARRGGSLGDRARTLEGQATFRAQRCALVLVVSGLQPAVGILFIQSFFHCHFFLFLFHLFVAETQDDASLDLLCPEFVDDGIFLPAGICARWIYLDFAA